ncbi:hypothetical protein HPDFL43_00040 [Hoeflea phototrophica DFL-43]|jgi:hypothetical protein|uniref:Uncharacterized protein n=1 Tax=Hoeflea phototrophica (strain DSM 17068 / NCIMB 14078 / DFL-43) TaxID=411684 RepID=A9CY51_HOEPD|nr:hypothetical protein [Hoeflea phototrophica]EDQ34539.1 hypothetical protein HPDFL43_00040 [Hoeflea phototrophica DFL-43]
MRSYLADFNDRSRDLAGERQAIELDGLNAARSGFDNGRNASQLAALGSDALPINKRGKDAGSDALDIILTTVSYEELLSRTYGRLGEAEAAVEDLITLATERFEAEQARLDELEAQAAQLPDGTRVARAEDGHIYAIESGRRISDEDAATIIWRGDEPDLETIRAQEERTDAALDVLDRARTNEIRLGDIREELSDQPSRERVHELEDEIDGIVAQTESDYALLNSASIPSEVPLSVDPTAIAVPEV